MRERRVGITPRLATALEMLKGSCIVADVGCDHGKLAAALLQRGVCERVIASDISEPSLEKAKYLMHRIGLEERVDFRVGDGLHVLAHSECDAIAMLGMGGTLMREIMNACETPLMGAKSVVLQPMRAQRDIREYLYRNCFHITDDRIVYEHGRYYEILRAVPGTKKQDWPDTFPKEFFDVGYYAFTRREPNLSALCRQQLLQHRKRLKTAEGTDGEEKLTARICALQKILTQLDGEDYDN